MRPTRNRILNGQGHQACKTAPTKSSNSNITGPKWFFLLIGLQAGDPHSKPLGKRLDHGIHQGLVDTSQSKTKALPSIGTDNAVRRARICIGWTGSGCQSAAPRTLPVSNALVRTSLSPWCSLMACATEQGLTSLTRDLRNH